MGNTCTNLHLVKPPIDGLNFDREIKAAYKQLGYEPAGAQSESLKRVVISGRGGERAFLSIHDSDNVLIDSGELKQLAVTLSKRLKTSAVVTSIYDSDKFEFIVFNKGKQVDAVVSDPDDQAAGMKMLSAAKRQSTWKDIFFAVATYRAMIAQDAPSDGAAKLAAIMERERAFDLAMQRVGKVESAFAEDGLGACCEAAGLDIQKALTSEPIETGDEPGAVELTFVKLPTEEQPAQAHAGAREIKLAPFISDDDWIAPKYYPAAWPFAENQRAAIRWLVTSSNKGFSGIKLRFELPDAPPTLTGKLSIQALPFYNGQISSANAVAFVELPTPPVSEGKWTFDIAPFVIPDLDPQTRKQIILLIVIEVQGTGTDIVTFCPTLSADSPMAGDLALPPARLHLRKPTWIPKSADMTAATKAECVLKLNAPTVFSMTAVVQEEPATLARVRSQAEAWLSAQSALDGTMLCIKTMKHMSASFRVAKSERTVPLSTASADKQWPKLFDPKSDYQSVFLRVMRDGSPFPVAGFNFQAALRDGLRPDKEEDLKHVRDAIRPYLHAPDHALALNDEGGSAAVVAAWMLNDPAIFEALGTTPDRLAQMFEGWMAEIEPIQAWITRAAWIPEFDLYEGYHQTPYEATSSVDWFRSGLNGLLARRAWACRRLRFVAPMMWLGKELAAMVDTDRLATVADLNRDGSALRVELGVGHSLSDLEAVLSPILPRTINE